MPVSVNKTVKETLDIISRGAYCVDGVEVSLGDCDFRKAILISPQDAQANVENVKGIKPRLEKCKIIVDNINSFEAARAYCSGKTLILNFANAYYPGGGFMFGALAQEESLCRCSTLYASLTSENAGEMYRYNAQKREPGGSDTMLLSPNVCVFRNSNYELLAQPFYASVITAAAPDLARDAARCSDEEIKEIFIRKIKNLLATAACHGYASLVLGAWGCGAFGNDAKDVSSYFYQILVEENMQQYFERVVFAVYSKYNTYNLMQFQKQFGA